MKNKAATLLPIVGAALAMAQPTALNKARRLKDVPRANATSGGQDEGIEWWIEHDALLHEAWNEWSEESSDSLPSLDEARIFNKTIIKAFDQAWASPSLKAEHRVKAQWSPVIPDQVYSCPEFISPEGVAAIRAHLEAIEASGVPVRRPNGMNRYGQLLHPEIPGGATYESLDSFLFETLVDRYVRPLGRVLFPSHIGKSQKQRMFGHFFDEEEANTGKDEAEWEFDDETPYSFSIRYEKTGDKKLNEHSDASVVTININLNLQDETGYHGSSLYFDPIKERGKSLMIPSNTTGLRKHIQFSPGMAVVHRGLVRHAALPIQSGERHQLIIWLFGANDYVRIAPYEPKDQLSVTERWSTIESSRRRHTAFGVDQVVGLDNAAEDRLGQDTIRTSEL